jgi:lysophospholipase L1-like esterase
MIFLCLGNSLTAGYPGYNPAPDGLSQGYGNFTSQYEYWLKKKCLEYLEKKIRKPTEEIEEDLIFINKGIPGQLTRNFLRRIDNDLIKIKPKPDFSIIIGGTNDLGWGLPIEKILDNIKKLHNISKEGKIISIGATIPPIRMEQSSGSYNQKKIRLNRMLEKYFDENNILFADLYHKMQDAEGNLKKQCSYLDGLHFSIEGYKQMGIAIFDEAIKEILDKTFLL